jgi:hypothetical protein
VAWQWPLEFAFIIPIPSSRVIRMREGVWGGKGSDGVAELHLQGLKAPTVSTVEFKAEGPREGEDFDDHAAGDLVPQNGVTAMRAKAMQSKGGVVKLQADAPLTTLIRVEPASSVSF